MKNHGQPQKFTGDASLKMLYIKKVFQFTDAGFQREIMSAACVVSSPGKHSLFFKKQSQ